MADRIYLHIGPPKTGTSYLQLMLWKNRELLEAMGVHLPLGRRRAHFDAVADLRGGMWADPDGSATWEQLVSDVAGRSGTALVSEELFCATPPEQIKVIVGSLAPVDVHVIFAARDFGRQIPAEWQQAVRARSSMTYSEWLEGLRDDSNRPFWQVQNPLMVIERWGRFVDMQNMHLITIPQVGGSPILLWQRFASIIGVDPDHVQAPSALQNESLGIVEAELLRRVNGRLGSALPMRLPYTSVVRDYLLRPALLGASDSVKLGVPAEHGPWIRERSERMVEELRESGCHVVGDLDDLIGSGQPSSDATPDEVSDERLLDAALDSLVKVLLHVEKDLQKRGLQQRRNRAKMRRLEARVSALSQRPEHAPRSPMRQKMRKLKRRIAR